MSRRLIGYKVKVLAPGPHQGKEGTIDHMAQDGARAGWGITLDDGEAVILTRLSEFELLGKDGRFTSYGPSGAK